MQTEDYFFHDMGNLPIIISVPHGGTLNHDTIPKRKKGITGTDKHTITLAKELLNYFELQSELVLRKRERPSFIMARIPRRQIDFNRPKSKAFVSNNPLASKLYEFYHERLTNYIKLNIKRHQFSLLMDIHGFEKEKRPEGYRDVELVLGTDNLKSLFPSIPPKKDWSRTLRGKIINDLLELKLPIAPGFPKRKEYVLTGGFITCHYGASNFPGSKAIQFEFSDRIRLCEKTLRESMLKSISRSIIQYLHEEHVL